MIRLNISSLEFEDIKTNIKEYYKSDPKYTDYNFEGSTLSSLLNIHAYNTHYIGFYVKMVLNEAFPDTAQTREALISHAKRQGYIVKGKTSSYASVSVLVNGVDPSITFITIPSGTTFNVLSSTEAKTAFITTTDYTIRKVGGVFKLEDVIIQQGEMIKTTFAVSELKQSFRINDDGCDINSMKVYVKNSTSTSVRTLYSPVVDIIDILPTSEVWYTAMSANGVYDVYFGEDTFGKQPQIGTYVDVDYVSTLGEAGNNVNKFSIAPSASSNPNNIGYYSNFVVTTIEASHGGVDEETLEQLRYNIPNHNRRQKRVVNENDYKSVLLAEFRDVQSITVYGGEKNLERQYAKMFVSIKPYNSDNLSETAKTLIRNNLVKRYGIVGSNIIFQNPEYINLNMDIVVKKNKLSSINNDQIVSDMMIKSETYNKEVLTKFESMYSDTDFITYLREDEDYITSVYTRKTISKKTTFVRGKNTRYHVIFANAISNIISEPFEYGIYTNAYIKSEGNQLYVYNGNTNLKLSQTAIGFADLNTGDVYIDIPRDIYNDDITLSATPLNPDIETVLNNIIRFSNINIEVV